MSQKTTLVRQNKKYRMLRVIARPRGRGSKFQWNAKAKYVIIEVYSFGLERKYTYDTFAEADKAWLFLTLRDL